MGTGANHAQRAENLKIYSRGNGKISRRLQTRDASRELTARDVLHQNVQVIQFKVLREYDVSTYTILPLEN